MAKQFTSWSYTRYADWAQCPRKAKLKHLDKVPEPPSPAMEHGRIVHKAAEDYLKGKDREDVPESFKLFDRNATLIQTLFDMIQARPDKAWVEGTWAFTSDWKPCRWNDWDLCAVRIKVDLAMIETATDRAVLVVRDWKTGKFSPKYDAAKHADQLELYAVGGMLMTNVDEVRSQLVFTDAGVHHPESGGYKATREELPGLQAAWDARVAPMLCATEFPPNPNPLCNWCWYGQAKKSEGGPGLCEF